MTTAPRARKASAPAPGPIAQVPSMESVPKVSVIIPAYNAEAYLAEAIESAVAQKDVSSEIILIDDGSTDSTPSIAARFEQAVRYVRRDNGGVAAALNTGIEHARGDYVALLAADDVMCEGSLARRSALLDKHASAAFVHGGAYEIDENGKVLHLRGKLNRSAIVHGSSKAFSRLLRGNDVICSTVMARTESLTEVGGFDQTLVPGEDWAAWLFMAAQGEVVYVPDPLALYRIHSASITARMDLHDYEAAHKRTLDLLFEGGKLGQHELQRREAYAAHYRRMALTAAYLHERRGFLRHAVRALRIRPGVLTESDTWKTAYFGARTLVPDPLLSLGRRISRTLTRRDPAPYDASGARTERPGA